jgi:hypothetical protein
LAGRRSPHRRPPAHRTDPQPAARIAQSAHRDERRIAHHVAVDTCLGLPDHERAAVAKTLVGRLGNLWHGHHDDLDTGVAQPYYTDQLTAALTARRHLGTPERPDPTTESNTSQPLPAPARPRSIRQALRAT